MSEPRPARTAIRAALGAGLAALLLVGLGFVFQRVLVLNPSDNAYLYVWAVGALLIVASVPFALATLLPPGGLRRVVVRFGLGLVWVSGALGGVLLVFGLMILVRQQPFLGAVFASHLAALVALALAVYLVVFRLAR